MDQYAAPVVWSPATRDHDPRHEVWVGVATEGTEVAARVDAILECVREAGHRIVEATPHADDVLRTVHDPALLEFLATARTAGARVRTPSWSARTASCPTCSRPRP